jgi:hypothetical protein
MGSSSKYQVNLGWGWASTIPSKKTLDEKDVNLSMK